MVTGNKLIVIVVISLLLFISAIALIFSLAPTQVRHGGAARDRRETIEEDGIISDGTDSTTDGAAQHAVDLPAKPADNGQISNGTKRFLFAYFDEINQRGNMIYNRFKVNTCYKIDSNVEVASFDTFGRSVLIFDDPTCTGHARNVTGKEGDVSNFDKHHPTGKWKGHIKSFRSLNNEEMFMIDFFSEPIFNGHRTRLYLKKGSCQNLIAEAILLKNCPVTTSMTTTIVSNDMHPIATASVNTHVNCIYAFDGFNCVGNMTIIEPYSRWHRDLIRVRYPDGEYQMEEVEDDGWANRIHSIKSCNGDHDWIKRDNDYNNDEE